MQLGDVRFDEGKCISGVDDAYGSTVFEFGVDESFTSI